MIGGMVGNNSCGAGSIAWETTRDHLVSARGFLADGSEATFGPLDSAAFAAKSGALRRNSKPRAPSPTVFQGVRISMSYRLNSPATTSTLKPEVR